ncbi:IS30 family transposase, partial [Mycobacterium sp. NAZ190054]|uniref:IS30 family transposase n=1 Tax=Mycobacterium sp. NAZ190054 TaxID=1747766 RepID=UPI001E6260C1
PHNGGSPWSAGCDESCTSGAEGGPGKRARSNPGTAPRSDPYIVGAQQRSAVATLVERKMRLTLLIRLPDGHSAQHVGDALIETFNQLPVKLRRTLTWDQGNEMFQHERIEAETGLKIYFADPHSPWQRGSNENTNGLVRQYLPKGTDLSAWDDGQLQRIADELNDRPRLCLKDSTPTELLRRWERQYTLH